MNTADIHSITIFLSQQNLLSFQDHTRIRHCLSKPLMHMSFSAFTTPASKQDEMATQHSEIPDDSSEFNMMSSTLAQRPESLPLLLQRTDRRKISSIQQQQPSLRSSGHPPSCFSNMSMEAAASSYWYQLGAYSWSESPKMGLDVAGGLQLITWALPLLKASV